MVTPIAVHRPNDQIARMSAVTSAAKPAAVARPVMKLGQPRIENASRLAAA